MRQRSLTLEIFSILALIAAFTAVGSMPCAAQTRLTSLEELQRGLAVDDDVTVVKADGESISGRLVRLGAADFDIRRASTPAAQQMDKREVTITFKDIQSLERFPDSTANGVAIGAGVGAALGVSALVLQGSSPGLAIGGMAVNTLLGALIGWLGDKGIEQPHIRFDTSPGGKTKVSVQPISSRGKGIALVVSF